MTDIIQLSPEDQDDLQELLQSERLCYNDISEEGVELFGVKIKHVVVGYFGFEIYAKDALFRSLLVMPDARKRGYGGLIWENAKRKLKERGVSSVYLLTDTAEDFFRKHGFGVIPRDSVPTTIANTTEFKEFCPDSSTCMKIELN